MDDAPDGLREWPMTARLVQRLQHLRPSFPSLDGFSDRCLRGDPGEDTLFLVYEHDRTDPPDSRPRGTTDAFPHRGDEAPAAAPRPGFGERGLRLLMRFDRGAARRRLPILSVCDFGEEQISLMIVEGPPTPGFRRVEDAIWGAVYEEVKCFELEMERP
jgi:hypothetical protein